ncbi:MAG: hypothetical protein INR62_01790 [Rhodospirillales bacterium]|nr:hypothetical protein [Acetobacter sp.]
MPLHQAMSKAAKLTCIVFAYLALCETSFGQVASQEWQTKAVHKYPELGVAGSPFNKRFLAAYDQHRKSTPRFFDDARWPLILADEVAGSPAVASPTPTRQATATTSQEASSLPYWATWPALIRNPIFWLAAVLIGLVVTFKFWSDHDDAKRLQNLRRKYDPQTIELILAGRYWVGQTTEELIDSLGYPSGTERKKLKTIDREIWKYRRTGHNRYGLRITVDDGRVAGWDDK